MNSFCEGCKPDSICPRHKMVKNSRKVELCQGVTDTPDGGLKYWNAWEQGRLGATAPEDPQINPHGFSKTETMITTQPVKECDGCNGSNKKQSLVKRAKKFSKAAAKFAASGFKQVTKEERSERLAVCEACEYLDGKICTECGCYVNVKAKWGTEDCPKGLWPQITDSTPSPSPETQKKSKTKKVSKDSVKTPQMPTDVKTGKIPKRPSATKNPPHVSFMYDHHGRPTDALDGLYPDGTAFLVCGGPSTREMDWSLLERPGVLTASINNAPCSKAYESKNPADMFRPRLWFSVDEPQHFQEVIFKDEGVTKFIKQKYRKTGRLRTKDGKHWVKQKTTLLDCPDIWYYRHNKSQEIKDFLSMPEPTWMTNPNRSVMFVAMRILFYMGIRRLYLIGCDFHQNTKDSYGFDDPMPSGRATSNTNKFERLNDIFTKLRPHFEEFGFQVLNCTPGGNLNAFDRVPLSDAIEDTTSSMPAEIETRGLYLK